MIRSIITAVEKNSCGSCALACLTGLTWREAKAAIMYGRHQRLPPLEAKKILTNPTTGRDLIEGGIKLGWQATTRCRPVKTGWGEVAAFAGQNPAIVRVQYENSRSSHWVVWDETGYIYDSNFKARMDPDEYPYSPLSLIVFREAKADYPEDDI